jgi:hypothetical protein
MAVHVKRVGEWYYMLERGCHWTIVLLTPLPPPTLHMVAILLEENGYSSLCQQHVGAHQSYVYRTRHKEITYVHMSKN